MIPLKPCCLPDTVRVKDHHINGAVTMSTDTLKALLTRLQSDRELLARFNEPGADAIAIAAEAGYEIDEADVNALPEPLSDADLDAVAGGIGIRPTTPG
jgi:predicted ribosomally synthesized peptide with nif11-like leader